MERSALVICTNVVLKIRSLNGKKFKVMELNPLTDLDILLLYFIIQCLYLVGGMVMIRWMIFFSTVSSLITGMKFIEQMDLHHNRGIGIQQ